MLLPTCSLGTPYIDDNVYERVQKLWKDSENKK
jgi:hypothetical protein